MQGNISRMLRIRVLSDLHLEFGDWTPAPVECDVLVLAGDIHQGVAGLAWARRNFPDIPIIYVPGNHEFYEHDWDQLPGNLAKIAADLDIHLLDRGETEIGGVRFLGCTLWTDFDLFGEDRRGDAMTAAAKTLFDYRLIRSAGRLIEPLQTRARHMADRSWLEAQLAIAPAGRWRATVVVTHMVPTFRSTAERFRTQLLSAGFASHLDSLVEKANIWIHGHTHDSYDYRLNGCRVVCNPRGYKQRAMTFENRRFDSEMVIDI
jgi:predicted phosphodiesterase